MTKIAAAARRLALFTALWFTLTEGGAALLAAAVVPVATWLSLRILPPARPIRLLPLLALFPGFVWRSLIGGVDVARRAVDPRLPLDPGWVEIPVDLSDGGRVALGGELSLMPGTLAAGSDRGRLLVHVLDKAQDPERMVYIEATRLGKITA